MKEPVNIKVTCPRCGKEWVTGEPIQAFDCLGCGARIVAETEPQKPKPQLRIVRND